MIEWKGVCIDREKKLVRITDGDRSDVITLDDYWKGMFKPSWDELPDCKLKEPSDPPRGM